MRAHNVNLYGDRSQHIGDIWLSAVRGPLSLSVEVFDVGSTQVDLNDYQVRQLRDACNVYLAEHFQRSEGAGVKRLWELVKTLWRQLTGKGDPWGTGEGPFS